MNIRKISKKIKNGIKKSKKRLDIKRRFDINKKLRIHTYQKILNEICTVLITYDYILIENIYKWIRKNNVRHAILIQNNQQKLIQNNQSNSYKKLSYIDILNSEFEYKNYEKEENETVNVYQNFGSFSLKI